MIKLLHFTLLFFFLFSTPSILSQEDKLKEFIGYDHQIIDDLEEENLNTKKNKDFSYKKCFGLHRIMKHKEDTPLQEESITWIDIISADEGADFNCSGGFCMHESHFHKRGLTLRKQLFDYFMRISC